MTSLRKDLVRVSHRMTGSSSQQIAELLVRPQHLTELEPATARRLVAYHVLRWLDDFTGILM